ncbi:hypothetical protein Tco_0718806 [Tanacetum coccineum]
MEMENIIFEYKDNEVWKVIQNGKLEDGEYTKVKDVFTRISQRFNGMDDAKRSGLAIKDKVKSIGVDRIQDEEINHASIMAFTVNNEVSMCSKLCLDSYNALKAKYDELQSEFGDQEAALTAHKIGLKKGKKLSLKPPTNNKIS